MEETFNRYDCIVIGGGPAGLSAAAHAAGSGYRCAVIEQSITGGHLAKIMRITDYPEIGEIGGYTFAAQLTGQAEQAGAALLPGTRVLSLHRDENGFSVVTDNRTTLHSRSVIVATGLREISTGLPEEERYKGKGVSYCAECDGSFFRNKPVMVYGNGPGADEAVSLLSATSTPVYHVTGMECIPDETWVRRGETVFTLSGWHLDRLEGSPVLVNIQLKPHSGEQALQVDCNGLFVYRGSVAADELLQPFSGDDLASIGLFTAGQLAGNILLKEICDDGTVKAESLVRFLRDHHAD